MSKKKDRMDWHHRKPRSIGGADELCNMSYVNAAKHVAWHILFLNMTAREIVAEINRLWIDPNFKVEIAPQFPSQLQIPFEEEE